MTQERGEESGRITAVYIDGNTVMAAVVSRGKDGDEIIHALRLAETEELMERVDRVPHPIFVNTEHVQYPTPEMLSHALRRLLEDPEFHNPVLGVLPPDLVTLWADDSPNRIREDNRRVHAGIRAVLNGNPYAYPKLFSFDRARKDARGKSTLRFWSCRFDDMLGLADQLLRLDLPFLGVVTAQRAFAEIIADVGLSQSDRPPILVDIGKLRTTYAGSVRGERPFIHVIPVGMARDDRRYFSSFTPTLHHVRALSEKHNGLFIPTDYTPSSSLEAYASTPQVEVTRFATVVAEYMARVVTEVRKSETNASAITVCLSGLAGSIPHFTEYLEKRAGSIVVPFDQRPNIPWQVSDGTTLSQVRSGLPAIGGALAYLRRQQSHHGFVLRDRRPERITLGDSNLLDLKPEKVYMLEWNRAKIVRDAAKV
jgi:hypothetical protein